MQTSKNSQHIHGDKFMCSLRYKGVRVTEFRDFLWSSARDGKFTRYSTRFGGRDRSTEAIACGLRFPWSATNFLRNGETPRTGCLCTRGEPNRPGRKVIMTTDAAKQPKVQTLRSDS